MELLECTKHLGMLCESACRGFRVPPQARLIVTRNLGFGGRSFSDDIESKAILHLTSDHLGG